MARWLVIGVGGATCSGKTTLSKKLNEVLKNSRLINQDSYFFPEDDPRHTHIPELNHHNWDILTSLDMNRMYRDVMKVVSGTNVAAKLNEPDSKPSASSCNKNEIKNLDTRILIIDGFLIFNYKPIADLCNLKYFLTITKQLCWERRRHRVYNPPDVPGYFDKVIWPEYEKYLKEIEKDKKLFSEINFIDGTTSKEKILQRILDDISKIM